MKYLHKFQINTEMSSFNWDYIKQIDTIPTKQIDAIPTKFKLRLLQMETVQPNSKQCHSIGYLYFSIFFSRKIALCISLYTFKAYKIIRDGYYASSLVSRGMHNKMYY